MPRILLTIVACWLATAGACSSSDPAGEPDARTQVCAEEFIPFTVYNFEICGISPPTGVVTIPPGVWNLDGDTGALTEVDGPSSMTLDRLEFAQPDGTRISYFGSEFFELPDDAKVHIHGVHPVSIVASGSIGIAGTLVVAGDVSSASEPRDGAGGDDTTVCGDGRGVAGLAQSDAEGDSAGAGGSGGGFGAAGGDGGGIDALQVVTTPGNAGGDRSLPVLRGGCRGGAGADAGPGVGGAGGTAGGAIQLMARNQVLISATGAVTANGGDGVGGLAPRGGGGGGGSGGAILIEASTITLEGHVLAMGGSGGEGADATNNGIDGERAEARANTAPAGGTGPSSGGDGGQGGAGASSAAGDGGTGLGNGTGGAAHGGGGGGGAHGRIRLNAYGTLEVAQAARILPPPTSNQDDQSTPPARALPTAPR